MGDSLTIIRGVVEEQVQGYTGTRKGTQFHAVRLQEFLGGLTLCVPEKEISGFVKRKLVILCSSFVVFTESHSGVQSFVTNVGWIPKKHNYFGP
jgi:hypothetical protein